MYSLKQGVAIFISPEIEKMLDAVSLVYSVFRVPLVVTSGLDGPHREGSEHFRFRAFDIRKIFPSPLAAVQWDANKDLIFTALREQFRVRKLRVAIIDEQDHIHFEWIDK